MKKFIFIFLALLVTTEAFAGGQQTMVNGNGIPIGTASNPIYVSGGGGVAGSDTQVQFNDGGVMGGDAGFVYNKTTDTATIGAITATGNGGLYGDPFNDYMTKIMFGQLYPILGTDIRLLLGWMSPATTELDYSGYSTPNPATYVSMETADQTRKGFGWVLNVDGTAEYLTVADSAAFNFGNGSTDSVMSIGGWFEVVATAGNQILASKYDTTSGSERRQWSFYIDSSEKVHLDLWDESANVTCRRIADAATSNGFHSIIATYAGTGGATACDGITIYVDGLSVAATSTNNASYVAMEDLTNSVYIGANQTSTFANLMTGDIGPLFLVAKQLSALETWEVHVILSAYLNQ